MAHYDDCKLTLEAGKHCLLEKPATLNAAEWKSLSELAKSKKLFLMEGASPFPHHPIFAPLPLRMDVASAGADE